MSSGGRCDRRAVWSWRARPSSTRAHRRCSLATFDEFEPRGGSLNLVLGAIGVKFNPTGSLLLSANVLYPLSEAGLRSRLTTVVGLDFAF